MRMKHVCGACTLISSSTNVNAIVLHLEMWLLINNDKKYRDEQKGCVKMLMFNCITEL